MDLWGAIVYRPDSLADEYKNLWSASLRDPRGYYIEVRDQFNQTHEPRHLLYLLARCVKAAVRYNSRGEFNQGADHRRLGARPPAMRSRITSTSAALVGKATLSSGDFRDLLHQAVEADVVYMDPPYQGTSGSRDGRYLNGLGYEDFVAELKKAITANVSFMISYDGSTGGKTYGEDLPLDLGLLHLHLAAGVSSQATLSGTDQQTIESLYLSPALVERLGVARLRAALK
jgi:DNA adenine methylase